MSAITLANVYQISRVVQGTARAETVQCDTSKRNGRTRERNANITHKTPGESGHLDERKLPRGIQRLFTPGKVMLHVNRA